MKKEKNCYYVDLDKKVLRIRPLEIALLKDNLKSEYDRKIFQTLKDAEKYITRYSKILNGLNNKKICKKEGIPAILYKRRYIVQSLMKEKNQTFRDSDRVNKMMSKVKNGEMFNLYDQTFTLTVVLIRVSKINKKTYKYNFRLP